MLAMTLLKISRPGLWLVFIWLYLWPTGGRFGLLSSPKFWLGLLYCTFPLNLLVYGMNDLVDEDVDKNNPRKGNFIYGAIATKSDLRKLPFQILCWNVAPLAFLSCLDSAHTGQYACWLLASFVINFVYNNKPFQLSRCCPWELPTMILGHFLIPALSCQINGVPLPSAASWMYHSLLLSRSHIWLEFADIEVDSREGKRTIAVFLGPKWSLALVLLLTFSEAVVSFSLLNSWVLAGFSLFGILVFWNGSTGAKVKKQKTLVSVSQTLVGAVLMGYLWYQGVFS